MNASSRHRISRILSLVACVAVGLVSGGCLGPEEGGKVGEAHPKQLVLGFVPAQEADKISDTAQPLADYLSKELKIPVVSKTATTYIGLVEGVGSAKVDIAMLSSLAYVLAHEQYGAQVLLRVVRHGSPKYRSIFIARKDSGINNLDDAKDKRIAFVDPASTSGYLFPAAYLKSYLKSKGEDSENYFRREFFAGGHDRAVMAVYNKDVDVATVFEDARTVPSVKAALPDVMDKVKIIDQTEEIPNDTVSVRRGLDPELVKKITAAFVKYAASEEGKKVLKDLSGIEGLIPAQDSDYEIVRKTARIMEVGNMPPAPQDAAVKPAKK